MIEKFVVTWRKCTQRDSYCLGCKECRVKSLVAACLTEDEVTIHNVPLISDFFEMIEVIKGLGGNVTLEDHTVRIHMKQFSSSTISLKETAKSERLPCLWLPY